MTRPKVIIIGGGFGGLNAAQALKNAPFDVLLIDKSNHHLFQPLLYQVATAVLSPGEIATPLREIFRKQTNATILMGEVTSIDKKAKCIRLGNQEALYYDYLIIATGVQHSYFGNHQWEEKAPGLKTLSDALKIREQILLSFEKAERLAGTCDIQPFLNFVLIGGGPTGVEMAGAIAEIAYKTLLKNFRKIRPEDAKIYLVEALPQILPVYPTSLSSKAEKSLADLGVEVIKGKKVTEITSQGVQLEDRFIPSQNIIWAAGTQASSLLKTLDTPLDPQGRAKVENDLSIPSYPEIYVIGDAAHALGKNGKPLPGVAQTAIQQGKYVARLLLKKHRKPFQYLDKGSMATIGRGKAIAKIGKLQLSGFIAWLAWCLIHVMYLIGFRSRLGVLLEWLFYFFTGQRGARLIYRSLEKELTK